MSFGSRFLLCVAGQLTHNPYSLVTELLCQKGLDFEVYRSANGFEFFFGVFDGRSSEEPVWKNAIPAYVDSAITAQSESRSVIGLIELPKVSYKALSYKALL